MSELLEMLGSLAIPDLVLCAVAVVILDLFALAVLLAANRESQLCARRWQKVSANMELCFKGQHYPLEADEILIGRHISADIRIADPSVSRYHAVLTVTGGVWSITDLGGKSGTYVNEHRVHQAKLLPGDSIRIGNSVLQLAKKPVRNPDKGGA